MIEVDSRAREILLILLRSNELLSLDSLASRLHLSVRQVRYAMPKAERWLESQGVSLLSGTRGERWLKLGSHERTSLVRQLERFTGFLYILSGEERIEYELIRLLTSEEPLLVKQLQSTLSVSRTTIQRDLTEVAMWLEEHSLAFWSRPHVGIHFTGTEQAYREALVSLLITIAGTDNLLAIFRSRGFRSPPAGGTLLQSAVWSYIRTLNMGLAARQVVRETECRRLADSELIHVFLYLGIATKQICAGHCVMTSKEQTSRLHGHWAFRIARGWCEEIAATYHVIVPDDEAVILAAHLAGAKAARFSTGWESICDAEARDGEEVAAVVDIIVNVASRRLHPFLHIDPLLVRGLTLHLAPVLERLRFGRPITNPLAEEVQAMYPGIYTVAIECSESVGKITGMPLPAGEVAFLAMHLGAAVERLRARPRRRVLVVCSEGIATAWLLVSRLRSMFPFVDVVDVVSARELYHRGVGQMWIDVIVSTIELSFASAPVLVVSPLLSPSDVARVSTALGMKPAGESARIPENTDQEAPCLVHLVKAMRLRATATDWQDVTRHAGDLLVQQGIAEPRYTDAMIALIRRHGPYMVIAPGIALLHALPQEGTLRLGMALVTLRQSVPFGHASNDPVDIVFAFACLGTHKHLRALAQLVGLLDDPAAVRDLRQARKPQEVQALLQQAALFSP